MIGSVKDKKMITVFEPIDFKVPRPAELIDELDIEALGKSEGKRDLPPTNAKTPDSNELNFKHTFHSKVTQASLRVQESYAKLSSAITSLNVEAEVAEVERLPSIFEEKAKNKRSTLRAEVKRAEEEVSVLEDEMDLFKRENKIKRGAHYPESVIMTIATFVVLLVVESAMNGYFFAQGNDFGLLGGVLQAGLVSVVNLAAGGLLGFFCFRQLNHVAKWRKYTFGALAIILMFLIFIFNLLVGHYRTALANDPDNAARVGWDTFTADILALGEFDSWMLFIIGCVIAILVSIKAYGADDSYPSYGRLDRKLRAARGEVEDLAEEWSEIIQETFEEVSGRLHELQLSCKDKASQLDAYHNSLQQQMSILEHYTTSLDSAYQTCVMKYREINSQYRSTEAPGYFSQQPEVELAHRFVPPSISDKRAQIKAQLEDISKMTPRLTESLHAIFQRQIQGVTTK
jgi:hypothetical protein